MTDVRRLGVFDLAQLEGELRRLNLPRFTVYQLDEPTENAGALVIFSDDVILSPANRTKTEQALAAHVPVPDQQRLSPRQKALVAYLKAGATPSAAQTRAALQACAAILLRLTFREGVIDGVDVRDG